MKIFELDIKKLSVLLLPTFLRKRKMTAWVQSLVAPLVTLQYGFVQKRKTDLYKIAHNGQVCFLKKALNDTFDTQKRRITIVGGNQYSRFYIYTQGENKTVFLGKKYLRNRTDFADTGVDFIVEVPVETYQQHEMESLINFYRLAAKRYKIVQI
ncbi:MAG: hypothetical protein Q4G08_11545 [Capnocytophaga sp.]|nr:hypothetical protein [Capnocytophaga sp.]